MSRFQVDDKERAGMPSWIAPPQVAPQPAVSGTGPSPEASVITPADFRKIIFKRKWIIIIAVLLGLAVATYYIVTPCRNLRRLPAFTSI
jgi:hypothetical protein